MKSKQGLDMLERVRGICRPLPEVEEIVDGFGHNVMKVRGKTFVMMGENEGVPSLSFKSTKEEQFLLLQQEGYVKTPYIGHHGWVSVDKSSVPNWDELAVLIKEAYLLAAPKRLVKQVIEGA
ncbi:MmcQ/YjbR family DNA-binding protein [Paenibacillus sp. S28]|uniref:MmcQ/YjbR family DNA-binding protein n=1 Tax=Paenibacillus sp. S28 TaxID=2767463 RepID=UPI00190E03D1|nr:MmcQ/YjbR family DNA-binding protein [Paenibacillus sp. S28]MBJ9991722.1 MmcQ/YjbR family DNA-binding protein [Paenibacillus sp. S28]